MQVTVADGNRTIPWVNELEWVEGEVWANIYQTGERALPLRGTRAKQQPTGRHAVLCCGPFFSSPPSPAECIARVDPATGRVKAWILLHDLRQAPVGG